LTVALVFLLGAFVYWAFFVTEGAYLGARVVAWTYDLTAAKYDRIKQFHPQDDEWLLSMPLLRALNPVRAPLILDVATGTGRMPRAILSQPAFRGYVVGLDLSRKMLQQAQAKLSAYAGRYALIWGDAQQLAFEDETFDAVCCLEALEFMPKPRDVLKEMGRVLRPGGIFLTTNRVNWESRLMPGKAFRDPEMLTMLEDIGLGHAQIRPWQVYYDLVWARKEGMRSLLGRGTAELASILRCPTCQHAPLRQEGDHLRCPLCGSVLASEQGIIDATF